ncbi:MAG TPA: glycerol-3-phosphate 1-O-acyltransferase [Desulfobulbus sp.]|nr:glycerol-3-phosphate 1-O-acyltransferase [Desulfobulbus sp.]
MNTTSLISILFSYLLGAIPFGLLLSRGTGVDIRKQGSGNIGATNVARLLGRKLGILTLLLDVLKGFVPIWLAGRFLVTDPHHNLVVALCGAATVLGHMFPVYLGFRGGKGVATGLGVFLYLEPLAVLYSLLVFVTAVVLSGFVSLGSLLAALSFPLWLYLLGTPAWTLWLAGFVVIMIWIKHHENIRRLLNGTEKSWKKKNGEKE